MQKYKNLPFNSDLFVIFLLCAISIIMHSWGGLHAQKTSHQNEKITHIKAGCEYNYSPYCFENKEGQAAGFSVELLKAAASEMDLKIDFKTGVWSKLKQNLANKELDALPLVGRTPVREDIYDFTFPYLTMHGTIVVRKDQTNIHSITDLKNKQVAVLEGDNAEEYLKRIDTDLEIIPKANFTQALLELSRGKHDAVVIQKYLALQIIKENNISNLKTVGDPQDLFRQSFCFAVSEGDKELLSLLNEGLSLVIANGTFRRLHKKWFAPLEAFEKLPQRIVIGGDNNFPPYEFLNKNGEPDGYNVDLTRALANQLDITIEIQLGPWAEMREKLKRGEIDALQGMFYSPKRDKTFDMSPAHTVVSYVIVARKNSPLPDNMSELSDKSILVQEGDIMHDKALQMELDDQLISTESQEDALRLLANGKHDCALVTKAIAYYYIDKNNWTNLRINEDPIYSPEYCYAVRSGNTVLLAKISDALSAIKASGQYRKIHSKWLGIYEEGKISFVEALKYSLFILIPLLFILIISISWSYTLKKKVDSQTQELRHEIESRKKAQQALKKDEQKYRAIVETTREAMVVSQNLEILFFNTAFCELSGYSESELQSIKLNQILVTNDLDIILKTNKNFTSETASVHQEMQLKKKSDEIIDIEVESTKIEFQGKIAQLLVCRDISERKLILSKLQKTKDQVDKLGDFIPICSSCKKIQDRNKEEKPWVEPEIYIEERLENINFSHGICPECMKKLYPEYYHRKYNKFSEDE